MKPPYISLEPLIRWPEVERPIQWNRIFPNAGRLHMEIGFGLGDFLVNQAKKHPDWGIIGVEVAWPSIRRTLRKIAIASIPNVRLIQLDARIALERLIYQSSLSSIDSLFPCPWPKNRHLKHRLFSAGFLKAINSRLVMGGKVKIVTDHQDYFEWIIGQSAHTGFDLFPKTVPPGFATKYERKWLNLGQERFFQLQLTKKEHLSAPPKEDITVKTHRLESFDHEHFRPFGCRGDIVVEFKDYIFDSRREKGMVRSLIVENGFKQDFWIEIQKREEYWHIHPAKGCGIIPTAGAQKALDLVRQAARQSLGVSR